MIIESVLMVVFALIVDFALGDPKNKYHPTFWIGSLIAKLAPTAKNVSANLEKLGGTILVLIISFIVLSSLVLLDFSINLISEDYLSILVTILVGGILLKTTIAIKGMEKHALSVVYFLEKNKLEKAQASLAMIVKRNTKNLDKNHVLSGVIESVSENTVDGITGPLFYFAFFGLPGAFLYRTINTFDSMIGYKTQIFSNLGWFAANCDKVLNYLPARLTSIVMVIGAMILGKDWRASYRIMIRDATKTESSNAGYPMSALAGALGARIEKLDHYSLGEEGFDVTITHIKSAISLMKLTSILFCCIITIPIILALSYLGWWIHA